MYRKELRFLRQLREYSSPKGKGKGKGDSHRHRHQYQMARIALALTLALASTAAAAAADCPLKPQVLDEGFRQILGCELWTSRCTMPDASYAASVLS
eukprot:COSAG05_NODE_7608_length_790_cov_1.826339_1_plen_96_part_10